MNAGKLVIRERKFLITVLVVLVMLVGCTKPSLEDLLSEARDARALGQWAEASVFLRRAVSLAPERADLRLDLAATYLEMGNGVGAEVALRKASELGAGGSKIQLDIGHALFLQKKYATIQTELAPACSAFSMEERIECLLIVGKTQLNTPYQDERTTMLTFVETLRLHASTMENGRLGNDLINLRQGHPVVEAAYQHYECGKNARETYRDALSESLTSSDVLRVGPTRLIKSPSAAAQVAQDGQVIEIDAATYRDDVASWYQKNLVLRGVGGKAHLQADGRTAEDKAIWVIKGDDVLVENIEFSGATSPHRNGAGIRIEGKTLTIRNSFFHHNENGVLGGRHSDKIVIENSEFAFNGFGDGQSHNIYIGPAEHFILKGTYSHDARVGHLVKSRARENWIVGNRLMDEESGNSSYVIDLPVGGVAYVFGNLLQQGPNTENPTMLSFAAESKEGESLLVANNTFYNRVFNGNFIHNHSSANSLVINNLFDGAPGVTVRGNQGEQKQNLTGPGLEFSSRKDLDFRLTPSSPGVDKGVDVRSMFPDTFPFLEYEHPARSRTREIVWSPDLGALEFCGFADDVVPPDSVGD